MTPAATGGVESSCPRSRWHGYGTLKVERPPLDDLKDRSAFGERNGYEVPQDLRGGNGSPGPIEAVWEIDARTPTQPSWRKPGTQGTVRLWLDGASPAEVFTGTAPGNPARDRLPFVLLRRTGMQAVFRAVLEVIPCGKAPHIRRIEPLVDGVRVVTGAGVSEALLPSEPR